MSADDWRLSQATVDFRNEERRHRNGRNIQVPACDRCSQGVMDSTNPHLLGACSCECHAKPAQVQA